MTTAYTPDLDPAHGFRIATFTSDRRVIVNGTAVYETEAEAEAACKAFNELNYWCLFKAAVVSQERLDRHPRVVYPR